MCLILFSLKEHPKYKLIIAANRDEFYSRPTAPAAFWNDGGLLAGRDLEAGGTWMGLTKKGRLSMLTNYRDLTNLKSNAPSRGNLVTDYLVGEQSGWDYLKAASKNGDQYNGYNLISGNINELFYYGNYQNGVHKISKGVHGLSNALLNTEWPKVVKGRENLKSAIASNFETEDLFQLLLDSEIADDKDLPDTGIGYEKEKMLSPLFIKSESYGSRCSTIILVDYDDNISFSERTYNVTESTIIDRNFEWQI